MAQHIYQGKLMPHIHTLKPLPSKQAIQNVSSYSELFEDKNSDLQQLLISFKETIYNNNFIVEQDNLLWATTRGVDYFANPKLFAQAPLNYICVFISEIFKNFEIDEIMKRLPASVLQQALQRLKSFS